MIEDFKAEVQSKLEFEEVIEKFFIAKNYELVKTNYVMKDNSRSGLAGSDDYAFAYSIVITNKRIFIGNTDTWLKTHSYSVYELRDIEKVISYKKDNLSAGERNKDVKFIGAKLSIYYGLFCIGPFTVIQVIYLIILKKLNIIDEVNFFNILALALTIITMSALYLVIRRIGNPNLVADITFKDGSNISFLLEKRGILKYLEIEQI